MDPAHKWDLDTCRGKGSWLYHEILSYCPTTTYTVILRYTYNCAIIRSSAQRRMNVNAFFRQFVDSCIELFLCNWSEVVSAHGVNRR